MSMQRRVRQVHNVVAQHLRASQGASRVAPRSFQHRLGHVMMPGVVNAISQAEALSTGSLSSMRSCHHMQFSTTSDSKSGVTGTTGVQIGDRVHVEMEGRLSNGKEFAKNTFPFIVGSGDVIEGINDAVMGMEKDMSKSVDIEPAKAFGAESQIYSIPRKELKISPDDEGKLQVGNQMQLQEGQIGRIVKVSDDSIAIDLAHEWAGESLALNLTLKDRTPHAELSPAEKLVLPETIVAGDNTTYPRRGNGLVMHYTGKLASNGKVFDSSVQRGEPFQFVIGVGQVIKGWDEGVMRMSKGEKAILNIPAVKGYGASGAGDVIPPNADLVFEVELLDVLTQ